MSSTQQTPTRGPSPQPSPTRGGGAKQPFLAWPGWPHLRFTLGAMSLVLAWFWLVYGGCDWLTRQHARRVPVHFAWELNIPFVPAMTVFYSAVYVPMLAGPFILRKRHEITAACTAQAVNIALAGVGFLLFPSELAYGPTPDAGPWAPLFDAADVLNLKHNLAPSLHVALGTAASLSLWRHSPAWARVLLALWPVMVGLGTLYTHQHHVVDVVSGYALAAVVHVTIERKLLRRLERTSLSPETTQSLRG